MSIPKVRQFIRGVLSSLSTVNELREYRSMAGGGPMRPRRFDVETIYDGAAAQGDEHPKLQWTGIGCDVCGYGTVDDVDDFDPRKPCPVCGEVMVDDS